MRVLVVEDAPAVRARLVEMLREIPGVEPVAQASSWEQAVAAMAAPLDVVMLDLHLGRENGLSLIPHARAEHPDALVVVLTSDPSEHHRRECVAQGADFFFDKTSEFDLAVEVVRSRVAMPDT